MKGNLRLLPMGNSSRVRENRMKNQGLECTTLVRLDVSLPEMFRYSVNSWLKYPDANWKENNQKGVQDIIAKRYFSLFFNRV